ncbi:Uncharacterised protein [Mycobacteroides abscessus subsp. abscessus]|nr:Uncharacterised protein [Mycobacteroides abscessus subsp. abscessus]
MMPPFVRVVPHEVAKYGAAAALVLAHVRWRCETDGPGRMVVDAHRWWRVSHRNLGREVGLSQKSVKTAIAALGDALSAKHFPPLEDQSRAYRVADDSESLTGQKSIQARSDLPEAQTGQHPSHLGSVPSLNGPGTEPERASALPIETLETNEEGGDRPEPAREPLDVATVPGEANNPLPQNLLAIPDPDAEPARYCSRHPAGTDAPCGACGRHRREHEAWQGRQRLPNGSASDAKVNGWLALAPRPGTSENAQCAASDARLAAIPDCDICDASGYTTSGRVCDHVDRTETARAGIAKVRAALRESAMKSEATKKNPPSKEISA